MKIDPEYLALAYRKALLLHAQDKMRYELVQKETFTEIFSEDLPGHMARVPGAVLLDFLKEMEADIQKIEEKMHAYQVQEVVPPPVEVTATPPSTPFNDETFS